MRAFVPLDGQRVPALHGRVGRVADHRHPARCEPREGGDRENVLTPLTAFAFVASKRLTLPPNTGQRATTAYSMPGTRTSMPKAPLPSTLPGMSARGMSRADDLELLRVGERHLRSRGREVCSLPRPAAVGEPLTRGP